MANKSIGTAHEKRSAVFWNNSLGFLDVYVSKDNAHMHDLRGGPFPIECKKRQRWEPQAWAKAMREAHGDEWLIHLEVRDMRSKDAPPKVLMMSEEALLSLKEAWAAGDGMTAQDWFQIGIRKGFLELT